MTEGDERSSISTGESSDSDRAADLRAGVFVLAALILLAFFYFYGKDIFNIFKPHRHFVVRLDQAGGLQTGSSVRTAGVTIGTVTAIRIVEARDYRVEADIKVTAEIPLRAETRASIRATEFVIGKYVELQGGDPDAPLLNNGDAIPGTIEPSIDEIVNSAGTIILKVKDIVNEVTTVFTEKRLDKLVDNTTRIVEIAGTPEDNVIFNIKAAIKTLADSGVTEDVAAVLNILAESKEELVDLISRGSRLAMDSNQLIIDHQKDLAELIVYWSSISKTLSEQIDPMARDMRTIAARTREASETLPAVAREAHDILPKLNQTLTSLNTILSRLEKIDEVDIRRFLQHEGIRAYLLKNQAPPLPEDSTGDGDGGPGEQPLKRP